MTEEKYFLWKYLNEMANEQSKARMKPGYHRLKGIDDWDYVHHRTLLEMEFNKRASELTGQDLKR